MNWNLNKRRPRISAASRDTNYLIRAANRCGNHRRMDQNCLCFRRKSANLSFATIRNFRSDAESVWCLENIRLTIVRDLIVDFLYQPCQDLRRVVACGRCSNSVSRTRTRSVWLAERAGQWQRKCGELQPRVLMSVHLGQAVRPVHVRVWQNQQTSLLLALCQRIKKCISLGKESLRDTSINQSIILLSTHILLNPFAPKIKCYILPTF